jgi:hypothetical protein
MCPNLAHLLNHLVLAVRLVYVRVRDQFMTRMVKDQVLQFVHVSNPEAVFVDVQLGVLYTRRQTDVHFYTSQIEPVVSRDTEATEDGFSDWNFLDVFFVFIFLTGFEMNHAGFKHKDMIKNGRVGGQAYDVSQPQLCGLHMG